jgi:hypothetical protein
MTISSRAELDLWDFTSYFPITARFAAGCSTTGTSCVEDSLRTGLSLLDITVGAEIVPHLGRPAETRLTMF